MSRQVSVFLPPVLTSMLEEGEFLLDKVGKGLLSSRFENICWEHGSEEVVGILEQSTVDELILADISIQRIDRLKLLQMAKSNSLAENERFLVVRASNGEFAMMRLRRDGCAENLKTTAGCFPASGNCSCGISVLDTEKSRARFPGRDGEGSFYELMNSSAFKHIITGSAAVLEILKEAELHALSDIPVLITGESGTGKELLARAIHLASPRAHFPFTPVNMASIAGTLFDAEFFGHTRGAFTGAENDRSGYLEYTNRGTLFLDEIGNLSVDLQGKLLRVLQEGEFIKVGTSRSQRADVRFIAATNEDMERMVARGLFRKDLYYRLKGAWLHLPPLRERREDIPHLTEAFLQEFRCNGTALGIEEDAMSMLMEYDYPGNIRELRSILQAAANLVRGKPISASCLPDYLRARRKADRNRSREDKERVEPLANVEKTHILNAYRRMSFNKAQTARLLGIGINTLRRKLESYGME